ncbi:o-succinylbenzoate--CoA ligase [Jeotgalibacillus sp. S-D1]|uniref:o-succinylbenzoate--CoA ligase n=1 Tax=Jeotgalibacillus sp. S-D1 TaxID=2552189 RepID=UPI001059CA91|nr:o-succinylbenzoate--CoA ligase [Jeotgalibacillus sp. S-D1]TDL34172.1 o-succinylbenzoate--CoA ligase [Jeotgalibacillus sp. S-D1]
MNPTGHWLTKRASLTPNRLALRFEEESWTFGELLDETNSMAKKLQSLQLVNKPVALLIQNTARAVILIHALQKLGLTVVMLNPRLKIPEWHFQLADSEAQLLIADDRFELHTDLKDVIKVLTIDALEQLPLSTKAVQEYERDTCSIMYTSGTTGQPKGVKQTYENHFTSAVGSALNIGLNPDDSWICAVPIFHISGYSILMRSVIYGNNVTLYEKFDEKSVHQDLVQGNATMISVVATMLTRLLAVRGNETYHERFRCMLLGGGPAAGHVVQECFQAGIPVFQTYGMTETSSQFATLIPEDSRRKIGSSGKPLFLNEIKIIDSDHKKSGPNEIGEIAVKGPNVTTGYINRPSANREAFQDDWFYTGDIGYLDEEGFLFVLDRRSDLIISGGENIYPAEIEAVLSSHPSIEEAAVVGKKDSIWGEVPAAFVVQSTSGQIKKSALTEYCLDRLAGYKVPKTIYFMDKLPRNASNKLLRRELKKKLEAEHEDH